MIWAYFIQFSTHMAADETCEKKYYYLPAGSCGDLRGFSEYNHLDEATWDEMIKFISEQKFNTVVMDLGDQVQWEKHPEICAPNAWSKEKVRQKLNDIRALGMTPIPSLNFSACHDTWMKEYRRMFACAAYHNFCKDMIDEAMELFDNPKIFHLGLDEESSIDCHKTMEAIMVRGEKLIWEDYNFLFGYCLSKGARPWMYADYFWDRPEPFIKNVSKEVLISNWYYQNFQKYEEDFWLSRAQDAYEKLDKLGYDQIPTSSTAGGNNIAYQTMLHCKSLLNPDRIKGYMTSCWGDVMPDEIYSHKNEAFRFHIGRKLVYPESL